MERPLRFCHITTFYPPYSFGGDATYVQQLSSELARRGHHVEVIHCVDSYRMLARGEKLRELQDHPNVIVHRLESGWGALSPLATQQTGMPFLKRKEIARVVAQGFDVIHYHNVSLVGGPGVLEMGDAVKLYTAHEYWLVCPMSVLFRYDGVACEETKCLRCTLAHGRPPQWWRYTGLLQAQVRNLDMVLYPSEFSRDKHRAMGLEAPGRVLRYFHRTPVIEPSATNESAAEPYFLFVGRLEKLKGAHTLVPVMREYPRARLILVGEGSQMEELKRLANGSPNIEFRGWLDHARLADLYRNATALIVPSLCYEGGPLVCIEAFSFKTPTIGRRLGALPELLEGMGGGITYTDDVSLRAAMDELLDSPSRRSDLGERGHAVYQKCMTPDAHIAQYFETIEAAMRRKGASRATERRGEKEARDGT